MLDRITEKNDRTFAGRRTMMSFANNTTGQLWASFMPLRNGVSNAIGSELYSIEVYPENFFAAFDPAAEFEKWAAVEISDGPPDEGLELLKVPAGRYAVFIYRGHPANAAEFYQKIFTKWLPADGLELDTRPHFAVMGERYQNDSDESEEEVWIPVRS